MTFACNGLVLRKVPGRDDSQLEVKVMVPGTERSGAEHEPPERLAGRVRNHVELMTISILGMVQG